MQRNNKFGPKNINLATVLAEKKITGENFYLTLELHLENITSCLKSLTRVVHVYLYCQLLISHNSVADGVKPEHATHTSDICHVVTACVGVV